MQRTTLLTILLAASLSTVASAQEAPPDLARVRSVFAGADLDHSGTITLREALAAGHSQVDFRAFDADGDGLLSQDEFLVGERERLTKRGERVARDLEAEAERALARRRAQRDARAEGEVARSRGAEGDAAVRRQASNARSRALEGLSELQRRAASESAARPSRAAQAAPVQTGDRGATARPASGGPAARRVNATGRASASDLSELVRERQRRLAASNAGDARVEQARQRVREERAQRARDAGGRATTRPVSERGAGARPGPATQRGATVQRRGVGPRGGL